MGGPFNRLFFELNISGDDLDPDEITEILGVVPDLCYRKDDERPRGSQYYKTGGWDLQSGEVLLSNGGTGEAEFEKWVQSLPVEKAAWTIIQERFTVRVRLIGYTDQWNADFVVSPTAIVELANRGLPLMIEPFLSLDEPDA
ncbi:MAG: hypothetical protein CME36_10990 [unclassified Hahellaceae]|nr:hypothetical protein [Hahellaceae bacterium]|tara:strand:+ start:1540 stop:1965 length:426 start_codon:yes stop_codon:yes gene_type:complete